MTSKLSPSDLSLQTRNGFLALMILILISSCGMDDGESPELRAYTSDLEDWQDERYKRLKSETGWVNLAGLFWLDSSWRSMGYAEDSDFELQYGSGPEAILLARVIDDSTVDYMIPDGLMVYLDSALVSGGEIISNDYHLFSFENLRWFFIERDGFHAIRLRDLDHPKLRDLPKLKYFPASMDWIKEGDFTPYNPVQKMEVPNVMGRTTKMGVIGEISFEHEGSSSTLKLFESSPGRGFLIFADKTNGESTYGGGRYLYLDVPENGSGRVTIDFNKAYSPPCEFTDYATCAFPPPENVLAFEIEAGEKSTFKH